MTPPAAPSSFDVAYWFMDRARAEGEHLQPQKLHRLMYLAQAYFAVAYHRRLLMPALFVAEEIGPVEPSVLRVCAEDRPPIDERPLAEVAATFLDAIWRRFGPHSAEYLNRMVAGHPPYKDAREAGLGCEITVAAMVEFYGRRGKGKADDDAPAIDEVVRPQVMRNTTGKPVSVQKWMPPARDPA